MAYNNYNNNSNNNRGGGRNGGGFNGGNRQGGGQKQPKLQIKAVEKNFYNPYTFVPFANKVYSLNEDELKELENIQDIPVEGSLSGIINIDFENVTPLCVRDGKEEYSMNVDERYFIPGSSIKGMIRSVFEILTYANARNGIANSRFSMRNLRSGSGYELSGANAKQKAGFIVKIRGKHYIIECHNCIHMTYDDLKQYTWGKDISNCSVNDKYKAVKFIYNNRLKGIWLFTGPMFGKTHEYLLKVDKFKETDLVPICEDVFEDFIFIHEKENKNKNKRNSNSWEFWKDKLQNYNSVSEINTKEYKGIVPCFFRYEDDKKDSIKDLGLARLYRQPYEKTLHDFLPEAYFGKGIDLADSVFGFVYGDKALKGRVQIGNTFIDGAKCCSKQTFILASPKPSFYPFYIKQDGTGNKKTYFSDAILSGTKRFILRDNAQVGDFEQKGSSSSFYPIDKGAKFQTKVYFHNLHDYELGALLAAITFCQDYTCNHSLGFAKPFGYGRLKVNNCEITNCDTTDIDALIKAFIEKLTDRCKVTEAEWKSSVNKLFNIARGKYAKDTKTVRYPVLPEFKEIDKANYSIDDFSPNL